MKFSKVEYLTDEELAERDARCGRRLSPRSTARCEMPPGHPAEDYPGANHHCGRTRGGYWKSWPVEYPYAEVRST